MAIPYLEFLHTGGIQQGVQGGPMTTAGLANGQNARCSKTRARSVHSFEANLKQGPGSLLPDSGTADAGVDSSQPPLLCTLKASFSRLTFRQPSGHIRGESRA